MGWSTNTIWPILTPKLCNQFGEYLLSVLRTMKQNFIACYSIRANINFVLVNDIILRQINPEVVSNLILVKNRLEAFILFYYHLLLLCTRPSGCHYNWFKLVLSCIPVGVFTEPQLRVVCDDNKTDLDAGWAKLFDLNYRGVFRDGNPILRKASENILAELKEKVAQSIITLNDKKLASRLERLKQDYGAVAAAAVKDEVEEEEEEAAKEKVGRSSPQQDCGISCGKENENEQDRNLIQKSINDVNMTLAVIGEIASEDTAAAAAAAAAADDDDDDDDVDVAVAKVPENKRRHVEDLCEAELQNKLSRLDDTLGELRLLLWRDYIVSNDPAMTELFFEGSRNLLEFLESQTQFLKAEDCRHPNLFNVTELPRPVFQDFGVGDHNSTFNTFNPFFASTIIQMKPFRFFDESVDMFTRDMCKIAVARQLANKNNQSLCNVSRNETMALDITMNKVYEAIYGKVNNAEMTVEKVLDFFKVAMEAECNIRKLELEHCNEMKKYVDSISLDPVMMKPGCAGTLKLFTLADIQHNLYPKVIYPPMLTLPSLNDEKLSLSLDLTQQFRQVQERLTTLYKQTYDSYLTNYESTAAIQNVLAQKTKINHSIYQQRVAIELYSTLIDKLGKLATFGYQLQGRSSAQHPHTSSN